MTRRSGVALLLACGLLALLLSLGGSFILSIRLAASATGSAVGHSACRLASGSGMEYTAARLAENPFPGPAPSVERRGDDWSSDPAYARGESWTDNPLHSADGLDNDLDGRVDEPFEGDGTREPDEPRGPDLDGDGRFSAWSGRLRGPGASVPFSLRIGSTGGGIPVNGGLLAPPHHNSILPDSHAGLARALNNLGAILLDATPDRLVRIGREDVPTGNAVPGEPIRVSRLGEHLLAARPPGGYRSRGEVDGALARAGYLSGERAAILRHLDADPPDAPLSDPGREPVRPVELSTTSFETLQALWRYLRTASSQPIPTNFLAGPAPPYGGPGRRSGGHLTFSQTRGMILYPDEAAGLAAFAERFRKGPRPASWLELRRRMADEAGMIFSLDRDLLVAAGQPQAAALWTRMKADVAFFALAPDRPTDRLTSVQATWNLPHPVLGDFHPVFLHRMETGFQGIAYPRPAPARWSDPTDPHDTAGGYSPPAASPPQAIRPVGLTLAPPVRFEAESRARTGHGGQERTCAVRGTLRTAERLEFVSQEDFENRLGAPHLADRGILVGAPSRPVLPDPDDASSACPWLVTLPLWHFPGGPPSPLRYPANAGAIALAGRACESFQAGLPEQYWSFTEDDLHAVPEREFASRPSGGPVHSFDPLDGTAGPWDCGGPRQVAASAAPLYFAGIGPPGTRIQSLTVEAWLSERRHADLPPTDTDAASRVDICGPPEENGTEEPGPSSQRIRVYVRPGPDGAVSTVNVAMNLSVDANSAFSGNIFSGPGTEIPYRDTAGHGRSGQDHVVFVIERAAGTPDAGPRHYRLYVNGTRVAERHLAAGLAPAEQHLFAAHADEIRIYDRALDDAAVAQRHALGRFVLPGPAGGRPAASFRSSRYRFDAPARLLQSGWTLIPCADPRVGVRVIVRGYDAGGNVRGEAVLDENGVVRGLEALGKNLVAFDYEIEFANRTADTSPLFHTPLFESIWFTVRCRGRAPAREEADVR